MNDAIGLESNDAVEATGTAARKGRLQIQVNASADQNGFCGVCTCRCAICVCRCVPK